MKKIFKNRMFSSIMAAIMMLLNLGVVEASTNDYMDIINYYPYSSWAVEIGEKYDLIFLEDNTRDCKRYEIASILYHILGLEFEKNNKFNDLNDVNDNVKNKINSVASANIINGYEDGRFMPNNNVTRAEFITMLDRADILRSQNGINSKSFSDIKDHWAKESIERIASIGVISGKGNDMFYPDHGITPQEILVIMDRIVNLKCITADELLVSMQNTFKCKTYGDKEKYIVEVMYNKFDEVQSFMKYAFPYKHYYNYNEWKNRFATYEEIQYITYFMMSYNSNLLDSGETRELFDNIGKTILAQKISQGENFTIRDLLYAITALETITDVKMYGYGFNSFNKIPDINYSNKNEFNVNDNELFRKILGITGCTLISNNNMYFPLDAPVTKYMLNYFAMKLEETYNSYHKTLNFGMSNFDIFPIEYETDISKLPANYYEYPYIIKGVPKEAYERPYLYNSVYQVRLPIECYGDYSQIMGIVGSYATNYYNTILNVDYRTIDEKEFAQKVKTSLYYVSDEDIEKYVQYVKENQIILEGNGTIIPGTLFSVDVAPRMRAMLKFKVVSAKEMKNLLFGDIQVRLGFDVEYTQDEYILYPDVTIYRAKLGYSDSEKIYKIDYDSVILGIYWDKSVHQLP